MLKILLHMEPRILKSLSNEPMVYHMDPRILKSLSK